MSEPFAPEPGSFDLNALRNAAQGRRPWRIIPRRHYADIRILSAMAEFAATMAVVMAGVFVGALLLAFMTALGLSGDWLSRLPGVLFVLLGGGLLTVELLTGRTPGKFFSGLRVCRANGAPADVGRLAIRFACKYAHAITIAGGVVLSREFSQPGLSRMALNVGLLMLAVHAVSLLICPWTQRRTWYDWLSGTAVFNASTLHEVRDAVVGFEVRTDLTVVTDAVVVPIGERIATNPVIAEPDRPGPA